MERFFNTVEPMIEADHYCIDTLTRIGYEQMKNVCAEQTTWERLRFMM